LEESLVSLEEALSLVAVDQLGVRAELVAKLAYAKRVSGGPFDSRKLVCEALDALSPTEREGALELRLELGKTNREIAAALFVSEQTVETHLAHVYSKLNVKSRTTLAALVARGDAD
jgi:DNA-binding NarL/FixJ family response regulator